MISDNPAARAVDFLKAVSKNVKRDSEMQQAVQSELLRLQEVVATFERDKARLITKRSELITGLGSEYPGYPWVYQGSANDHAHP